MPCRNERLTTSATFAFQHVFAFASFGWHLLGFNLSAAVRSCSALACHGIEKRRKLIWQTRPALLPPLAFACICAHLLVSVAMCVNLLAFYCTCLLVLTLSWLRLAWLLHSFVFRLWLIDAILRALAHFPSTRGRYRNHRINLFLIIQKMYFWIPPHNSARTNAPNYGSAADAASDAVVDLTMMQFLFVLL